MDTSCYKDEICVNLKNLPLNGDPEIDYLSVLYVNDLMLTGCQIYDVIENLTRCGYAFTITAITPDEDPCYNNFYITKTDEP